MFDYVKLVFGILVIGAFAVFCLMILSVLGADFYLSMKDGIGAVSQDRNTVFVKEFLKEDDKCVYVLDVWDKETKFCGIYSVKKF